VSARRLPALALALLLQAAAGCGGPPTYEHLLLDARAVSGCSQARYAGRAGDRYLVEGCGETLRMLCHSQWNEPWCCHLEGTPPPTRCAEE
jgi:hypothetical protein